MDNAYRLLDGLKRAEWTGPVSQTAVTSRTEFQLHVMVAHASHRAALWLSPNPPKVLVSGRGCHAPRQEGAPVNLG